ncbi:MAG: N-acetyl-alpha-D-glucosaminyl L-malate synthase BshA [Flavobacteriales bacterium]|nr:N-acetyl-alpha-D-glucosaminyl L-malate synthase BshA [Flavobacteriales bacterium]MBO72037.1 N-acetyl-alpha-D-glucosaminyl L-malate synthase BshA [Flavobacteriales bacterium]
MKIGIICYPTFGGSGVIATELGTALAKIGHEVHFITSSQPVKLNVFEKNIFFHEVVLNPYPLFQHQPFEVALTSKIVEVVKYENLDLLHVHYAIPHASAAYLAKQILKKQGIHIPYMTTLHGTDITLVGKEPEFEPTISFAINQSDIVTSVSRSLKEETYRHFKVAKEIRVIPNFVCISKFNKEQDKCKKDLFAPSGEKVLMHISNFRKVKRIQDVIKIHSIVNAKIPTRLILIGDGPERSSMERLAREEGVEDSTYFLGKIKETEKALCLADVYLMTSETESFGVSALEALASGVPVISSNTGGIPEVNTHNTTGFLSKVGDVEDMAKNLSNLLTDNELYTKFSLNALEKAKQFDISNVLPIYENLYDELLSKL